MHVIENQDFVAALHDRLEQILLPYCRQFDLLRVEGCFQICLYPKESGGKALIVDNLAVIVGMAEGIIPLRSIQIAGDKPIEATALREVYPVSSAVQGIEEHERDRFVCELFKYCVKELARDRSLFLIAPDGTYLKAWLEQNADPPKSIPLEGATLQDILGDDAAEEILRMSNESSLKGHEMSAFYSAKINAEERYYVGKIQSLSSGQFLMSVVRIR